MPQPVCHPGQTLVAAMLERDWRLSELAAKLDTDPEMLADFMNLHADLTPELADKLATVFDLSREFWLNLQANFDAAETASQQPAAPVSVG